MPIQFANTVPTHAVLKPIEQIIAEQEFVDKKRTEEKLWLDGIIIADEVAMEHMAAWCAHLHEVAERKAQKLDEQKRLDELHDKDMQRVLAQHSSIGSVNNSIYVDNKVYDESYEQLRVLDAEIAKLNRQIDSLQRQIVEAQNQYRQDTAEELKETIHNGVEEAFVNDYSAQLNALIKSLDSLEGKKQEIESEMANIQNNIRHKRKAIAKLCDQVLKLEQEIDNTKNELVLHPEFKYSLNKKITELNTEKEQKENKFQNECNDLNDLKLELEPILTELESELERVNNEINIKNQRYIRITHYAEEEAKLIAFDACYENEKNAKEFTKEFESNKKDLTSLRDDKMSARQEFNDSIALKAHRKPHHLMQNKNNQS